MQPGFEQVTRALSLLVRKGAMFTAAMGIASFKHSREPVMRELPLMFIVDGGGPHERSPLMSTLPLTVILALLHTRPVTLTLPERFI
jgi:hypothetical protein